MERPLYPKHKTVMVINDHPFKIELTNDSPFSSQSNMMLLSALRTGKLNPYEKTRSQHDGIFLDEIYSTYIEYQGFSENNFDYEQEVVNKKNKLPDFQKLVGHKDVWISPRLYTEITNLVSEIEKVNPSLIIVTGKWSLFFLTTVASLTATQGSKKDRKPFGTLLKYRASILDVNKELLPNTNAIVFPLLHSVVAQSLPDKVSIMEWDYEKVGFVFKRIKAEGVHFYKSEPVNNRTDYETFLQTLLNDLDNAKEPIEVAIDIETMFHSIVDCVGLAYKQAEGTCIPFAHLGNSCYLSKEEETKLMLLLYDIFLHKNIAHVGQNYQYDCQYFTKLWLLPILAKEDTMILQHTLFNYLPKDLATLASIFCEKYSYWKDDVTASQTSPETRWLYNCKDVCFTLEVLEGQRQILDSQDKALKHLYRFTMDKFFPQLVETMNRGILIDVSKKEELYQSFSKLMEEVDADIVDLLKNVSPLGDIGFNKNSTLHRLKFFKDFLGITLKKKKNSETTDAASMLTYMEDYPLYAPFLGTLLEYGSLKVMTKTFLGMKLDADNRARTQYGFTSTGRLNSRKNVWGTSGNLQNIPEKGKINLSYALEVVEEGLENDSFDEVEERIFLESTYEGSIHLPNVKKIFLPDEGYELFDGDYSGADIQIVAAESGCQWLLDFFANPKGKVYRYISNTFLQREITDDEYRTHKGIYHGSNYGMGIEKLASMSGLPITLSKQLQDFYFRLNPEIRVWQKDIEKQIKTKGYITNVFGRRAWFTNKNDPTLLNKALAFQPQGGIADLVNHAWVSIKEKHKENIHVSMQVHDSLVCQYKIDIAEKARKQIINCMEIPLTFKGGITITIPADCKVSTKSYGDCKKLK